MNFRTLLPLALLGGAVIAADYKGPHPPKPDVPYILHADRLVETEVSQAQQEDHKGEITYIISGASSQARTPLPEPIFIIDTRQLSADRLEMYKLDVKNGHRELTMTQKRRRGGPRPIHLQVIRLGEHLFRVEADEFLENGEYSLSPSGSNQVFCFEVY
jgi:hypothetical protein